jgi:peptidoglycan glycosyltransferase
MGLVAAAVANGGEIPTPHVVGEIRSSAGETVRKIQPGPWKTAVGPEAAIKLREDMKRAVIQGTARGLVTSGLEIGAKTGTAQVAEGFGSSHAWVIGFAGDPGFPPDVAFAVFVAADPDSPEQSGSRTAVPIARELVNSYFGL